MNKAMLLLVTIIFGLFFLAFGVYGTVLEFKTPPVNTIHLAFFLFLVLLGSVTMPGVGTIIFSKLKDVGGLAGPYLPTFGRRASSCGIS